MGMNEQLRNSRRYIATALCLYLRITFVQELCTFDVANVHKLENTLRIHKISIQL